LAVAFTFVQALRRCAPCRLRSLAPFFLPFFKNSEKSLQKASTCLENKFSRCCFFFLPCSFLRLQKWDYSLIWRLPSLSFRLFVAALLVDSGHSLHFFCRFSRIVRNPCKKQAPAWKTSFPAVAFSFFALLIFASAKMGLLTYLVSSTVCDRGIMIFVCSVRIPQTSVCCKNIRLSLLFQASVLVRMCADNYGENGSVESHLITQMGGNSQAL